jgi:hypothetical protein
MVSPIEGVQAVVPACAPGDENSGEVFRVGRGMRARTAI